MAGKIWERDGRRRGEEGDTYETVRTKEIDGMEGQAKN